MFSSRSGMVFHRNAAELELEHIKQKIAKVGVEGSNPFARSNFINVLSALPQFLWATRYFPNSGHHLVITDAAFFTW